MWIRRITRQFGAFVLTTLIAGLLGATLVRFGPGFDADEQRLDLRLDSASIEAVEKSHADERNLLVFYASYVQRFLTGDWGFSRSFARPVRELFANRAKVTAELMTAGVVGGWALGLALA